MGPRPNTHARAHTCRVCSHTARKVSPVALCIPCRYFAHEGKELEPDVVVLGKGIATGYPVSVVVGKEMFMGYAQRDSGYMLKVNTTVGTFAAWHAGIVAANVFLDHIIDDDTKSCKPEVAKLIVATNAKFARFAAQLNKDFDAKGLPVQMRNFTNVFSVNYSVDSFYNSFYPQYLMAEDIFLSNQTVGKFNLQGDATQQDLDHIRTKFVAAAAKMEQHGFMVPKQGGVLKSPLLKIAGTVALNWVRNGYAQIMEDKRIDIEVSHNHSVNRWGHFWSSIGMIFCAYPAIWAGQAQYGFAVFLGLHVIRQAGHFFYERQDTDFEKQKFGHKDGTKKVAAAMVAMAVLGYVCKTEVPLICHITDNAYVGICGMFTVVPHFAEITHKYGLVRGIHWALKILTDPFTDVLDFYKFAFIHPSHFLDLCDHSHTYDYTNEKKAL